MTYRLKQAAERYQSKDIVVVVGSAHVKGIYLCIYVSFIYLII
jgi:pheromone shutdown protein TraB